MAYVSSWHSSAIAIGVGDIGNIQTVGITVGDTPMYLAANPSGTRVYVPNRYGIRPAAPSRASVGVRIPAPATET
jgi:DNA-binding beta-propeller fold protein YncE